MLFKAGQYEKGYDVTRWGTAGCVPSYSTSCQQYIPPVAVMKLMSDEGSWQCAL